MALTATAGNGSARDVMGKGLESLGQQKETAGSATGPPAALNPFEYVSSI
jgi:hypothetical protein